MAAEHLNPWFWPGLGDALLALLAGAGAALHHGLVPQATLEGLQPADLGLTARSVRIPVASGLSLFAWYLPAASAGKRQYQTNQHAKSARQHCGVHQRGLQQHINRNFEIAHSLVLRWRHGQRGAACSFVQTEKLD